MDRWRFPAEAGLSRAATRKARYSLWSDPVADGTCGRFRRSTVDPAVGVCPYTYANGAVTRRGARVDSIHQLARRPAAFTTRTSIAPGRSEACAAACRSD